MATKSAKVKNLPANLKKKNTALEVRRAYNKSYPADTSTQIETRWEELDGIYQEAAKGIVTTLSSTNDLINIPNLIDYVENPSEFKVAVNGFKRDIDNFTNRLIAIKKLHEGKHGVIKDENELANSYSIYGEYVQFFEEFKAVTFQTVLSITESAMAAINKMQQVQKETTPVTE